MYLPTEQQLQQAFITASKAQVKWFLLYSKTVYVDALDKMMYTRFIPIPVTGKIMHIRFGNNTGGEYNIQLINEARQTV